MKVSKLEVLVLLIVLQRSLAENVAESIKEGADAVGQAVKKEVAGLGNPIAQGVSQVAGGSLCNSLKDILKLDKNHTDGDRAPNLDDLALVYSTPKIQVTIPLLSAATELPGLLGPNLANTLLNIFTHGFTDNPSKENFQSVNNAYHSIGMNATLGLDASSLISYCYLCSSSYVRNIGTRLGEVLAELFKSGLLPKNIHLVGHSLGAQISGFTGKQIMEMTGEKVGRITGLDPAGPCFKLPDDLRLSSTDAIFVDVIHTNAGGLGTSDSVGQADFYPNGGEQQENCALVTCNHSRAVKLFASSIRNKDAFHALQCADYEAFKKGNCTGVVNMMGEGADPNLQGHFFLQTDGKEPFGKGQDGMKYVNTDGLIQRVEGGIIGIFHG